MFAALAYIVVPRTIRQMIETGELSKARDLLQFIILLVEFSKKTPPIMQPADPEKLNDYFVNIVLLVKIIDAFSRAS